MTDNNALESHYYYSATTNMFYPEVLKQDYINAGSFPGDAKPVDKSVYQEFVANLAPEGKMRIAGKNGLPEWADMPPPTKDELIRQADDEKQKRQKEAMKIIAPLQYAVDLDMATREEAAQLKAWKKYIVLLNCVDTSAAPDIGWPQKPINLHE